MVQIIKLPIRTCVRCHAALLITLACVLTIACGCRSTHSVNHRANETRSSVATVDPVEEPSMAANVALQVDDRVESEPGKMIVNSYRPNPKLNRKGVRINHPPVRIGEFSTNLDGNDSFAGALANPDYTNSSLDRLNAALSDDAIQAQTLPEHSLTPLEARLRVDLLISRAKQLLDIGQFDEAYRNAMLAHELGETAQLDFSPEEDRPIDLLRQIEGLLEDKQLTDQSASEGVMAEYRSTPTDPALVDAATKDLPPSATQNGDKSRLARMRRDWSTLFKRDRKPPPLEAETVNRDVKVSQVKLRPISQHEDPMPKPATARNTRDGVVVANRSVTLSTVDPSETSTLSYASESADDNLDLEPESIRSSRVENSLRADADRFDEREARDSTSRGGFDADDSSINQRDFEVSEPPGRSRAVEVGNDERTKLSFHDDEEDVRKSDWSTFYILFGICSLLAVVCYRRGAT